MENARAIREESPVIGGYKLWVMLRSLFGPSFVLGRDSFYRLLRRHGLALPPRKSRHTTFSNHRYHKWKNLVKGFVPTAANQLWVADITYIDLAGGGVCYLHLITDAYSRKIIGWALADTLRAAISLQALEQAIAHQERVHEVSIDLVYKQEKRLSLPGKDTVFMPPKSILTYLANAPILKSKVIYGYLAKYPYLLLRASCNAFSERQTRGMKTTPEGLLLRGASLLLKPALSTIPERKLFQNPLALGLSCPRLVVGAIITHQFYVET